MGFTRVFFLWSCHPTDETRGLTLESKSHAVQNMTFTNLKDSLQGVLPPKTNVGGSNSRSKSMVFFEGFPRFDSAWSLGYWCHRPEKRMVGRLRFLSFVKLVPFLRGQTSSFSCRLPDMKGGKYFTNSWFPTPSNVNVGEVQHVRFSMHKIHPPSP